MLAATIEEDGALEHSLAFAGMAKNSAGGIYSSHEGYADYSLVA